jgi:hypothetical protein
LHHQSGDTLTVDHIGYENPSIFLLDGVDSQPIFGTPLRRLRSVKSFISSTEDSNNSMVVFFHV